MVGTRGCTPAPKVLTPALYSKINDETGSSTVLCGGQEGLHNSTSTPNPSPLQQQKNDEMNSCNMLYDGQGGLYNTPKTPYLLPLRSKKTVGKADAPICSSGAPSPLKRDSKPPPLTRTSKTRWDEPLCMLSRMGRHNSNYKFLPSQQKSDGTKSYTVLCVRQERLRSSIKKPELLPLTGKNMMGHAAMLYGG